MYTEEEGRPFIQELLFSEKLHSHIGSLNYVNRSDDALSAASIDFSSDKSDNVCDVMSTLFPTPLPDHKPIIMAKNLLSNSASVPILNSAHSTASKIAPISDYVNFLSSHKGFINEIV